MIKLKLTGPRTAYVMGLSEKILAELRKGRPVVVDMAAIDGPDADLILVWGQTDAIIIEDLERVLGTKLRADA